jgi:uncharacterized phage infection (PIP) family protein YhgE
MTSVADLKRGIASADDFLDNAFVGMQAAAAGMDTTTQRLHAATESSENPKANEMNERAAAIQSALGEIASRILHLQSGLEAYAEVL